MQPSQLRASHEDRDAVIEALRVAAGDGRLTSEELDERLEVAFNARTYGELATLTADLPTAVRPSAAVAPVEPKDIVRINCRSGNATRDGHWVVPRRMEVRVTSGNVKLDFTEAVIANQLLEIDAEVRSGNLIIITKPGVAVDTDDLTDPQRQRQARQAAVGHGAGHAEDQRDAARSAAATWSPGTGAARCGPG